MRRICMLSLLFALSATAVAQDEPVVMTINGQDIPLSEFEYFFEKNNVEGKTDKATLDEYAGMFLNFKLKVEEAKAQGIDSSAEFLEEFKMYRGFAAEDYLYEPIYLDDAAHMLFERSRNQFGPHGMREVAVLSLPLEGKTPQDTLKTTHLLDSLRNCVLAEGESFMELAGKYSHDESGQRLGLLGPMKYSDFEKDLAESVFSLPYGSVTEPYFSGSYGYLFYVISGELFESFEAHKDQIYRFMRENGTYYADAKEIRAHNIAVKMGWNISDQEALVWADSLLEQVYPEFANISREYYEGLLFFEISNRTIWGDTATDTVALENYFKKNKKQFRYDPQLFEGMVLFCKDKTAYKEVKALLDKTPQESQIDEILAYNKGDIKVRVMVGPVTKGADELADKVIWKVKNESKMDGYPEVHPYGKIIKEPSDWTKVSGKVVSLYQESLEKKWVASLRKKYNYAINKEVLYTIGLGEN